MNVIKLLTISLAVLIVSQAQAKTWPDDGKDAQRIAELMARHAPEQNQPETVAEKPQQTSQQSNSEPPEAKVAIAAHSAMADDVRETPEEQPSANIRPDPLQPNPPSARYKATSIEFDQLPDLIGEQLRIDTRSGRSYVATVTRVQDDSLDLKLRMRSGSANITLNRFSITRIRRMAQ